MLPLADAGLALTSDGQYGDGTYSVYANGVCGVTGTIFATTQKSNTGDAVIQTNSSTRGKSCSRTFTLRYPGGFTEAVPSFNNLRALQNTTTIIPIGATVKRLLILNPGAIVTGSRCDRLLFGVGDNPDNGAGSDSARATRAWRHSADHSESDIPAVCRRRSVRRVRHHASERHAEARTKTRGATAAGTGGPLTSRASRRRR